MVLCLDAPRAGVFGSRPADTRRQRGMGWDDFFCGFSQWTGEELLHLIGELECFGPSDEVCEAVCRMPNFHLENLLYHRALQCGVRFRREELAEMGHLPQRERGTTGKWLAAIADRWNYYRGGDDWEDWEVVRE